MKQMFFFNFGVDSDSKTLFRFESVPRFIYFNKIEYFVHRRRVVIFNGKLSLSFLIGHNIMKQMFFFNFGVWFGF